MSIQTPGTDPHQGLRQITANGYHLGYVKAYDEARHLVKVLLFEKVPGGKPKTLIVEDGYVDCWCRVPTLSVTFAPFPIPGDTGETVYLTTTGWIDKQCKEVPVPFEIVPA